MVINGGSRSQWTRFAPHLANEKDNEKVRLVEVRGMSAKTIREGFAQLQAMANIAGAGAKEFYYHANLNPQGTEELTPEQWDISGERLRQELKLDGQPGMTIEHTKGGRTHRHDINLRVDLESGKLIPDGWNYIKHEKTTRELERAFGLAKVKGAHVERDGPRPERRPKNWEVQRGKKERIDPQEVKAEVTALWEQSVSGAQLQTALARHGYLLCQGNRGANFCIVDGAGKEHSLARRIAGAREIDIRRKLGDIDRDALPSVEEARTERRGDKARVSQAVERGADKSNIERAINAGRTADMAAPEEGNAESDGRNSVYARTRQRQRARVPSDPRPSWQEREAGRWEKNKELEK